MKYIIFILVFLSTSMLKSQNLHVSTGIYLAGMTIKVDNSQSPSTYSRLTTNFDYLNLLFEKEITERVSWKTGLYLVQQNGYYTDDEVFYWQGSQSIKSHNYRFSITNIDLPFLLTYNFDPGEEKLRFSVSIGPYGSIGIPVSEKFYGDIEFYPIFYGLDLSAGIGSEKWNLTSYFLRGKNFRKSWHPKVNSTVAGVNLTRIIHFKK